MARGRGLFRTSMYSTPSEPASLRSSVHKTAGASFEHHALRDGLKGGPQGCSK